MNKLTPEQKAEEILNKYKISLQMLSKDLFIPLVKRCALILCDNTIESEGISLECKEYYRKVKIIIKLSPNPYALIQGSKT